jgi:hypothetical protein
VKETFYEKTACETSSESLLVRKEGRNEKATESMKGGQGEMIN